LFALEAIFSGTRRGDLPCLPARGKSFSNRVCSFGEFENGKMKARRDYWDSASMVKQIVRESE
jgi:ketosteroid isomerase-like protein